MELILLIGVPVVVSLIFYGILYFHNKEKKGLNIIYDELQNENLCDIVDLLKEVSGGDLRELPNEEGYFLGMYAGMLAKKKATSPYKYAIPAYETAMKICKKHNFTKGVAFFELQIKYYKKYIKWKENYNKENNITIEYW